MLMLAVLTGCGASPDEPVAAATPNSHFPVSIKHALGTTQIPAQPKRVVTVGFTDHDTVLALGVVPVGVRDWYGDYPNGVWPWAQAKLGDAKPTVLRGETLNIEAVAALKPDLILGMYGELTGPEYDQLSKIAPTVAQSADHVAYGTPWQEMTRTAGVALGRQDQATKVIADVEGLFAKAAKDHPEFQGTDLVYAGAYGPGTVYVESSHSSRLAPLLALGFRVPAEIDQLIGNDKFSSDLSDEQLDVLDHEVLFWELGAAEGMRKQIEKKALYTKLNVEKDGRAVFIDDPLLAGALAHATALSLPVALAGMVPMLADAASKVAK